MYQCSITGILRMILPAQLSILLLRQNFISGSIHSSMLQSGKELRLMDLSANALSASIPSAACNFTKIEAVLINNMRLLGTLPKCAAQTRRSFTFYTRLSTFTCTWNYLEGPTDALAQSNDLQTVVLASNFFTDNIVALDDSNHLGKGTYQDPAEQALATIGIQVQQTVTRAIDDPRVEGPVVKLVRWIGTSGYNVATSTTDGSTSIVKQSKAVASNPYPAQQQSSRPCPLTLQETHS